MTYQQTLDFLFNSFPAYHKIGKSAYKANLDNTLALDEHLGHPHEKFLTVHVAGTNGKGSVSHTLASIFQEAGYTTGLYTSPHLKDFRERIKINGTMISESEVVDFVVKNEDIIKQLVPSFFEITVAMAFDWFAKREVDIAIIEVGLGGRLDSTNIINPELSIITNIGLEHTEILGDTLEKIALEKAGIIKKSIPIVVGETNKETEPVFRKRAGEMGSQISFADKMFKSNWAEEEIPKVEDHPFSLYRRYNISVHGGEASNWIDMNSGVTPLCGDYQLKNLQTVFQAFSLLKDQFLLTENNLYNGIAKVIDNTGLLGRWQKIAETPLTICDTGHNLHGMEYTVRQISSMNKRRLHCVLGFSSDKDVESILQMFPKDASYYFTKAGIDRAMNLDVLSRFAKKYGLNSSVYSTVQEAYQAAKSSSDDDDFIFIGGSIFIVAEVL